MTRPLTAHEVACDVLGYPRPDRRAHDRRTEDALPSDDAVGEGLGPAVPLEDHHSLCVGCGVEVHHHCGYCRSPVCWTCSAVKQACCEGDKGSTWARRNTPRSPEEARRRGEAK